VATGQDSIGNVVTDEDDAAVNVLAPDISIEKLPDSQTITSGGDAVFEIIVTNTGDFDLFGVTVTDPLTPACDASIGDLPIGESTSYACIAEGVTADFTNVATVVGEDENGTVVTDQDDAFVDVLGPEIDIEKSPEDQTIVIGQDAEFTITVENTGDVVLDNVTVTDPLTPSCDAELGTMAPGDVITYACSAETVFEAFTNVATVVGEDPEGNQVTDESDAIVRLREPPEGQLPVTGSDSVELSIAGTLLLLIGAALVRAERLIG